MLYSGCFWQCYREEKTAQVAKTVIARCLPWLSGGQKVRFGQGGGSAVVSRRSMSVLEGFRPMSRPINVTRFLPTPPLPPPPLFPKYSPTVTQKAKEPITWTLWMLLHTEHFPLPHSVCSQRCLSYCWGHEVCPCRRSPVQPGLT